MDLKIPEIRQQIDFYEQKPKIKCSFWRNKIPTKDQLRWPIQIGIGAGMASLLLTFLPASKEYFRTPAIMAPVLVVTSNDATAGGSIKKAWLQAFFGFMGALVAFGTLCTVTLNFTILDHPLVPIFIFISSILLVIPACLLKSYKPEVTAGANLYLSTAETVLFGAWAGVAAAEPWGSSWKRGLACVIGGILSALVSQFVLPKAARPAIRYSCAHILTSLAEVLETLASSIHPQMSSTYLHPICLPCVPPCKNLKDHQHNGDQDLDINFTSAPNLISNKESCERLLSNESNRKEMEDVDRIMSTIQKCHRLLNEQQAMYDAAIHEISIKRPHRFPVKKYKPLINEINKLFFHIASLTFALNLYISFPKAEMNFKIKRSTSMPLHFYVKNHNLDHLSNHSDFSDPLSETDSPLLGTVARHFAAALHLLANALKNRCKSDVGARIQIRLASEAISEMEGRRTEQRKKFGLIILKSLEADMTRKWTRNENLDWRGAIGIDVKTYLNLSEEGKLKHWDRYWLGRDRISNSNITLITLKNSLLYLCDLVDDYLAEKPISSNTTTIQFIP